MLSLFIQLQAELDAVSCQHKPKSSVGTNNGLVIPESCFSPLRRVRRVASSLVVLPWSPDEAHVALSPSMDVLVDRSVLDKEPFCTLFVVHAEAAKETYGRRSTKSEVHISRKEFEDIDALGPAQAWLALAFASSEEEGGNIVDTSQVTDDLLNVYVQFHWRLHSISERHANDYLYNERKRRGFRFSLGKCTKRGRRVSPPGDPRENGEPSLSIPRRTRVEAATVSAKKKRATSEVGTFSTGPNASADRSSHTPNPAKEKKTRKKKKDKLAQGPTAPLRTQPSRPASHRDNLSRMMIQETDVVMNLRRGRDLGLDHSPKESLSDSGPVSLKKVKNVSSDTSQDKKASTSTEAIPMEVADTVVMRKNPPPTASTRTVKKPTLPRKPKKTRPKNLKAAGDLEPQVAKRRRSNDGSAMPVVSTEAAPDKANQGTYHVWSIHDSREDVVAGSSSSMEKTSGKWSRKDSAPPPQRTSDPHTPMDMSSDSRPVVPLPSTSKAKTAGTRLAPPAPALDTSVPRTPEDVESLLREAAFEAQTLLRAANEPRATVWEHEEEEDSSDDEDELDVPLKLLVAKAQASSKDSTTPGPSKPTVPSTLKIPSTLPVPQSLPKLPLYGYPPMWAQSRQEVCESFDWFRSYQGGVYFIHDMVKGYLLSAFSASRDIFHHRGKLIISHGGGRGAESTHKNLSDTPLHASDQLAEDRSVRALLKTMELKRPMVLIIDDKYNLFPFDLASRNCTYAVLGFYRIAHAWAEKQSARGVEGQVVVRYKFAFQWCQEQGDPWWWNSAGANYDPSNPPLLANILNDPSRQNAMPSITQTYPICNTCAQASPQVFAEGWMCLKPTCATFFTLNNIAAPPYLSYSDNFLQPVPFSWENLGDMRPPIPSPNPENGIATGRHSCRGALLTNYFSQNTGEEYHYVAGTENTVPWNEAPAAVEGARKLINERMKQALNNDYHFNEVLSAGYMEKQKMAFHSDAERGLGPTVASLSLGASAYMHFRQHAHFVKELPKDCSREVLSLYLKHGDVVVMEGADIQKYYEHTVVPLNFRIAATARFIDNSGH
ncbi:hypothetical protein EUX98_g2852 [Antrodiella citrinella]|uniref:Alpha-ketoglutarate-dependent dioxygenase AlkB-like domain-containing protein n=1 Tax=Antrodiella citrinella TaxID=2447956 RepID=A0A4S4N6A0_9APHY|nr:hypothetical protein EUX98_g2852 [Antrodiella citrinella]